MKLGSHLGTLGFLPLEIREQIWCATIDNYKQDFWQNHIKHIEERRPPRGREWMTPWVERFLDCHVSNTGVWKWKKYHHTIIGLDVFDLSSYHELNPESTESGAMHLRYASPEAKVELENMFVYTNAFRFFCPKVMGHYHSQLSPYHRALLRSISISLFDCPHCPPEDLESLSSRRSWLKTIRQAWLHNIERLPATLKSLTFELGTVEISIPANSAFKRRDREDFLMATELVEFTTKNARRRAPGAEIGLKKWWRLGPEESEFVQRMFEEVEPYSEDFKKWSIQSWINNMNQEEES